MIHSKQGTSFKNSMDDKTGSQHFEDAMHTPRRRDLIAGSRPKPIVPKSLSEAYRIAKAVCAAKMAPKGLDTPEACMIAIMHALEVGLSPLSALQRIAVINGRPTIWGDGALALVKASGLCEAIEEWIEGDDPQSWVAVCNLIRKHDPVPVERRFSTEDAKRAKLWGKQGPWSDYPKRMLQMRARAFALRDAFPDVLGGLYLTEEWLQDHTDSIGVHQNDHASSDMKNESSPQSGDKEKNTQLEANVAHNAHRLDHEPKSLTDPDLDALDLDALDHDGKIAMNEIKEYEDYGLMAQSPNHGDTSAHGLLTIKLPAIANLRRSRRMPRSALSLRFKKQWSIKQPKVPAYPATIKQKWDTTTNISSAQSNLNIIKHVEGDSETEAFTHRFVPEGDWEAILELLDAALCCARDQESLIEIKEEFSDRLQRLPHHAKIKSDMIFEKHSFRIEHAVPDKVMSQHASSSPNTISKPPVDEGTSSSSSPWHGNVI